jgi:hypothetical protein
MYCAEVPKGRCHCPHPLPQPRFRDAGADAVYLAGAVAVGYHARRDHRPAAGASLDVRGVDRGCVETHPHFAFSRQRIGLLADLQHRARRAVLFVPGREHQEIRESGRAGERESD